MTKKKKLAAGFAIVGMLVSTAGMAREPDASDTVWVLTCSVLLMFVTLPGLALFYGGLVRTKNVLSVLMHCFAITSLNSLLWIAVGYSLSFSDGNSWLGGLSRAFLRDLDATRPQGHLPEAVFILYHLAIASFASTLMVGGLAERIRFSALLLFAGLWLLLVYAPVCHWVWGSGWLQQMGVMDSAGGIVVQTAGGVAALTAALLLGPRKGFPRLPMPPHNLIVTATGGGLLWVGWHGFSAGSAASVEGAAGVPMLTIHIAAAAAALTWMFIEWIDYGKPSVLGLFTGMVAGLSMIAPSASFVGPAGAMAIGLIAGAICFFTVRAFRRRLQIDDALDVFPVNGISGIVGSLLTAVFASEALGGTGFRAEGDAAGQLAVQALGVGVAATWSGLISFGLLKLLDVCIGLRVTPDEETEGLDITQHDESGYNL